MELRQYGIITELENLYMYMYMHVLGAQQLGPYTVFIHMQWGIWYMYLK